MFLLFTCINIKYRNVFNLGSKLKSNRFLLFTCTCINIKYGNVFNPKLWDVSFNSLTHFVSILCRVLFTHWKFCKKWRKSVGFFAVFSQFKTTIKFPCNFFKIKNDHVITKNGSLRKYLRFAIHCITRIYWYIINSSIGCL